MIHLFLRNTTFQKKKKKKEKQMSSATQTWANRGAALSSSSQGWQYCGPDWRTTMGQSKVISHDK